MSAATRLTDKTGVSRDGMVALGVDFDEFDVIAGLPLRPVNRPTETDEWYQYRSQYTDDYNKMKTWLTAHTPLAKRKLVFRREWEHYATSRLPILLVEGFTDYLTAAHHLADVFNVVGSVGVAIMRPFDYLMRSAAPLYVCMDNDEAGLRTVQWVCREATFWSGASPTYVIDWPADVPRGTDVSDLADLTDLHPASNHWREAKPLATAGDYVPVPMTTYQYQTRKES